MRDYEDKKIKMQSIGFAKRLLKENGVIDADISIENVFLLYRDLDEAVYVIQYRCFTLAVYFNFVDEAILSFGHDWRESGFDENHLIGYINSKIDGLKSADVTIKQQLNMSEFASIRQVADGPFLEVYAAFEDKCLAFFWLRGKGGYIKSWSIY